MLRHQQQSWEPIQTQGPLGLTSYEVRESDNLAIQKRNATFVNESIPFACSMILLVVLIQISLVVASSLIGNNASGWFANLIADRISIWPDSSFNATSQPCTTNELLQASYPAFYLPIANFSYSFTAIAFFDQLGVQSTGKIVNVLGIQLSLVLDNETGSPSLLLTQESPPCSLFFSPPTPGTPIQSLFLSNTAPGHAHGLQLCINSQPAALLPSASTHCNAETLGFSISSSPSSAGVIVGDEAGRSARFNLNELWAMQSLVPFSCGNLSMLLQESSSSNEYPNSPPTLLPISSPITISPSSALTPDGAFLADNVSISVGLMDLDGDPFQARLTLFGVPLPSCSSSGCGDWTIQGSSSGSPNLLWLNTTYAYPRAGRYQVRIEATDGKGGMFAQDLFLLARKDNDVNRTAPCCRYSGSIVGAQQGRPIHTTVFRHPRLYSYARDLGWASGSVGGSDAYMNSEDLESERLFDYSILAPGPVTDAGMLLRRVACPDGRLGGSGGIRVQGVESRDLNLGHNKRLLVVPQGYDWALNVTASGRPWCQSHWSNWASSSPYKTLIGPSTPSSPPTYCSYACTREGVEATIEFTGLFDRWMERLIETSYGRVSFSPLIDIAPTIWLPMNNSQPSPYLYNDVPTRSYLASQGISNVSSAYRAVFVLAPLPLQLHETLQETGWSSYPSFSYFMQCNPQSYYLYHEMGHLFGLPHASVYRLMGDATSSALPTDPMGDGIVEDSYSDPFDTMACCKGDYSVYSRIMAGWIPGSERLEVNLLQGNSNSNSNSNQSSSNTTATSSEFVIWPFDRGESKGRTKAVTLRLSEDQILILSYRSNALWQDVRVGADGSTSSQDTSLDPNAMRSNTAGLTIEYLKRLWFDPVTSEPVWSGRGLIDLNLLFPLWPEAFPTSNASYAPSPNPRAAYAAMKEGFVWTDETRGFQIASIRSSDCPSGLPASDGTDPDLNLNLEPYPYSALGFYGFRGEYPGTEAFDRSDFSGYAKGLPCLTVKVTTGPEVKAPGKLAIRVRVGSLNDQMQVDLRGRGSGNGSSSSSSSCGLPQVPPSLEIIWPSFSSSSSSPPPPLGQGDPPLSVIWKDALNETFATDVLSVPLPLPLLTVTSSSSQDAAQCTGSKCPGPKTYWVKAAALSGAHTLVKIEVTALSISNGYALKATYFYFLSQEVMVEEETHSLPILLFTSIDPIDPNPSPPPLNTTTNSTTTSYVAAASEERWSQAMGVQLSLSPPPTNPQDSTTLNFTLLGFTPALTPTTVLPPNYSQLLPPSTLPSSACSRQWSFTFKLQIILDPRPNRSSSSVSLNSMIAGLPSLFPLVTFPTLITGASSLDASSTGLASGLYLVPSSSSTLKARISWQGLSRDIDLSSSLSLSFSNISQTSSARALIHLVWIRDRSRMGVWANGFGGWLADELACHNTQPLGSLRVTCPQASSNSTNEKETILPPFVLFGPSPSAPLSPLQTSKLISPSLVAVSSPRLYNFVLPIADLNEEAECDLQGVPCSTYFNLLSSNSNPYPPPSPPAGSIHISKALYDLSHPPSEPHDDPPPPFHSSQSYSQSWGQFTTISQDEVRTALGLKPGPSAAFSQGQTTTSNNFPQASSDSKGGISIAVIAGAGAGVLVIALVALVAWRVVVAKGRRPKVSSLPLSPAGPDISHPSRPPLAPPKHPAPPPRLVKRAKTDWEEGEELRIERAMAAASPAREGSIALREGGIGRASGIGIVSSPILRSNRKAPAPASQPAPLPLTSPTRSRREEADQV